jgi:hypothetical protein
MKDLIQKHTAIAVANAIGNIENIDVGILHANITKKYAMGFNNWCYMNAYKKSAVIGSEHLWYDSRSNYAKYYKEQELFDKYLETVKPT